MPVYPLRFTRYEGERRSTSWSWWHLALASYKRLTWNRLLKFVRGFWFLYTALFFLWVYLAERGSLFGFSLSDLGDADTLALLTDTPTRLLRYLVMPVEIIFLIIAVLFVGSGLLADDRRTGAIGLYLSKPVTRLQYLASRIVVVAVAVGAVSVLPAMGMVLFEILIADDTLAAMGELWLLPALLGVWVIYTCLFGLPVLVLSSLTDRGRTAGVMFVALWFMTDFVGFGLDLAWAPGMGSLLDLERLAAGAARVLLPPVSETFFQDLGTIAPTPIIYGAIVAYTAVGLAILWRRTRPTGGNR